MKDSNIENENVNGCAKQTGDSRRIGQWVWRWITENNQTRKIEKSFFFFLKRTSVTIKKTIIYATGVLEGEKKKSSPEKSLNKYHLNFLNLIFFF